jgi:hypothetical protein
MKLVVVNRLCKHLCDVNNGLVQWCEQGCEELEH